jgi:nitroreductase
MGQLLTVAAELKIDACPMEWLDPTAYDKVLGLTEKNLATLYAIPFGYRSEEDKYASLPKVRWEEQDIVKKI